MIAWITAASCQRASGCALIVSEAQQALPKPPPPLNAATHRNRRLILNVIRSGNKVRDPLKTQSNILEQPFSAIATDSSRRTVSLQMIKCQRGDNWHDRNVVTQNTLTNYFYSNKSSKLWKQSQWRTLISSSLRCLCRFSILSNMLYNNLLSVYTSRSAGILYSRI